MKEMSLSQKCKQLSVEDLRNRLEALRQDLCGLRVNAAVSPVKDVSQYKKLRKDIARIMTAIRAKEDVLSVAKKS